MTVKTDIGPGAVDFRPGDALKRKAVKKKQKRSFGDYLMSAVIYFVYALFAFVCVYPFYYIIINSISANNLSDAGQVILYPKEIHFTNFENLKNIAITVCDAEGNILDMNQHSADVNSKGQK